ncbi:MAG: hypothetical protein V2I33_16055, partial [Kangiellaceae bacterium]|nr:hypothetical protein [Kangiellaceae bacterium]
LIGDKTFEKYPHLETKMQTIWQEYHKVIDLIPVKTDWRALRVVPTNLSWNWLAKDQLQLEFELPSGSYATGLLDELGDISDASEVARHSDQ